MKSYGIPNQNSFCVVGVDQTGAVDSKGVPKPLPFAGFSGFLTENRGEVKNLKFHYGYLKKASHAELSQVLGLSYLGADFRWLGLDCVLGLPKCVYRRQFSFEEWLCAQNFIPYGFGRAEAERFFLSTFPDFYELPELPRREQEIALRANSVFKLRPFQKNIQTGTFRFWKEIQADLASGQFSLRGHEKSHTLVTEVYPSACYRTLGFQSRTELISKALSKIDSNWVDAYVVASFMMFDVISQGLEKKRGQLESSYHPSEGLIYPLGADFLF